MSWILPFVTALGAVYYKMSQSSTEQPTPSASPEPETPEFFPEPADVFVLRAMFFKCLALPVEVTDVILEHAEYWPHSSSVVEFTSERFSVASNYGSGHVEDKMVLRSHPVGFFRAPHPNPALYRQTASRPMALKKEHPPEAFKNWVEARRPITDHPARKVVFTITSRDQAWGGDPGDWGTYKGSWTWFDVGLERFDAESECQPDCPDSQIGEPGLPNLPICSLRSIIPPVAAVRGGTELEHVFEPMPTPMMLQCNRTVHNEYLTHRIEWKWTDNVDPESKEAQKMRIEKGQGEATKTGNFVNSLKLGDVVTVWAKARFPGWENNVERCQIDVFWKM